MLSPSILIADRHNLFIEGLTRIIQERIPHCSVVGATNIQELSACLERQEPDILFLNNDFVVHDFQSIRPALARNGYPEFVVLCDELTSASRKKAASVGALSVLSKTCSNEDIWQLLDRFSELPRSHKQTQGEPPQGSVLDRSTSLTTRQRKILELLACGMTNREISAIVGCAETTVKAHLNIAYKVLGVKNRTQAMYLITRSQPYSTVAVGSV